MIAKAKEERRLAKEAEAKQKAEAQENADPNLPEVIDTSKVDEKKALVEVEAQEEPEVDECPPELEQVDIEAERDRKKVEWLERVRDQERAMTSQVTEINEASKAIQVTEESKHETHASFEDIKSVIEQQPSLMESTEAVTDLEELD